MQFWILKPLDEDTWSCNPWLETSYGFIISAATESDARVLASKDCGAEGRAAWINPELSSCVSLVLSETAQIIMKDYKVT